MNRLIKGGLFFGILILIGGCEQGLPEVNSPEGILYAAKCGGCHLAPQPQKHTFKTWKRLIPAMEERVKATGARAPLTEEEKNTILDYLKKHSKKIF
ncbi:MAG: hypothetical protein ACE5GF_03275 [Thermodesulfobacteriota bacterium]